MGTEKIHPIYVIAGTDRYLRQEAIDRLRKHILGEDEGLGFTRFDGGSVELATVLDELRTLPFLTPRRVVVVEDADKLTYSGAEKTKKEGDAEEVTDGDDKKEEKKTAAINRIMLEKYFSSPSSTGVLILAYNTWRKNTRLAKMLPKVGRFISAEPKKGKEIINWIMGLARERGKSLARPAAQGLVQLVGNDAGRLAGEIEKLALYCGSRRTITIEDIEQLCGPTAELVIFRINDFVSEGRTEEALAALQRLLRQDRSAEFTLVGVLGYALRRLLKARALLDAGVSPTEACNACGVYPFMRETFLAQVERFSLGTLKRLVSQLAELDYASKTGVGNVKLNLEKFIVCAASK